RRVCMLLREADRPVRIMRAFLWPPETRERFFAKKARELPVVEYAPFDPRPTLETVAAATKLINSSSVVDKWLRRLADAIAGGARMLASLGTPQFHYESRALFGSPADPLPDGSTTSLGLALRFNEVLDRLDPAVLATQSDQWLEAEEV